MVAFKQIIAPQRGLKRQLILRFALVVACAILIGGLSAVFGYRWISEQSHHRDADRMARDIDQDFQQIRRAWEDDVVKMKAQIDFMRLLSGNDPKRWLALHAYLSVQEGEAKNHDTLLILRRDGSVAFGYGPESRDSTAVHVRALSGKWHLSEDRAVLNFLVRLPIWLGDEGTGTLVFLHPVENATLIWLAPPNVELHLAADNRVIASSLGAIHQGERMDANFYTTNGHDGALFQYRQISLGDVGQVPARLVMRQAFKEPLTLLGIIITAVALLALLSLMLWLVLGRWLQLITLRIRHLSDATRRFADNPVMDVGVRQSLEIPLSGADEIAVVSASTRDMMLSVERHQAEQRAYMQTLDMLEEGVVEIDGEGRLVHASNGWRELAECGSSSCDNFFECIHAEDKAFLSRQLGALFAGEKTQITGRVRLARFGHESWIEYRFVTGESGLEGMRTVRGVMRDITQGYQLEKRVTHMALHDALTGLPNRVLLEDRCGLSLRMAERTGSMVAIGFIDLDHFKNINDTFGHKTGDRLLVALAGTLKQALRSGDTLARWGGDEFVVLLSELGDIESARQTAQKLVDACARQIELEDTEFNVTFSIGMAIYPSDADNVETLLSQSDRAMFHAKEQGRNNVQFFCDMTSKGLGKKDVYIQNRLSTAIKNRSIRTWFQPIVEAKSRRVIGLESLARWQDEEYGWISPATFIPMAENLGLIRELGEQVWLETLRQGRRWRDMGFDGLRFAVNVSRRQLLLPSFAPTLLENLREFGLPPSAIILEITESVALTDTEYMTRRLKELADAGFTLAIDDFGTGYSSLSQLHHMPVGKIKIDISFVRRVHEPQGAQLVQAIIHMAEAFGLHSVAEGVEDEETALILQEYGVDFLQGYFFGKPMPAAEIDNYLAKTS